MKSKHLSISVKLVLTLVMALLFVAALGFRSTGGLAHELVGSAFCALCILHGTLNRYWYRSIVKGTYTVRRCLNTALNTILLPAGVLVLCVSGMLNSRHVFGFLNFKGGMEIRQLHSLIAYWGIVILGVHVGVQWAKVLAVLKNKAGARHGWLFNYLLLRCMTVVLVAYGLWASCDRAMGSKLFLGFAFDFWDSSSPEIFFYSHNIAILALYSAITHYTLKFFAKKPQRRT